MRKKDIVDGGFIVFGQDKNLAGTIISFRVGGIEVNKIVVVT